MGVDGYLGWTEDGSTSAAENLLCWDRFDIRNLSSGTPVLQRGRQSSVSPRAFVPGKVKVRKKQQTLPISSI